MDFSTFYQSLTVSSNKGRLLAILSVALTARFLAITYLDHYEPDSFIYLGRARTLISNLSYGDSLWPPAYPLYLSAIMLLFGDRVFSMLLGQVFLGAIATYLVYAISRHFVGETFALLAALVIALQPDIINHTSKILSETLFTFLIALGLFLFYKGWASHTTISLGLLSGLSFGAAALTRGSLLPLIGFLMLGAALAFRHERREPAILMLMCCVGMTVCLTPWTLRNYIRFGTLTPVSSNGGMNFYYGTVPDFVLAGAEGDSFKRLAPEIRRLRAELNLEKHQWPPDWIFWREYGRAIRDNPWQYLKLRAVSFYDFWTPWPRYAGRSLWKKMVIAASLIPIYVCFLLGLRSISRSGKVLMWYLPLSIIATLTLVHTMAFSMHRFFMPIVPILVMVGAYGAASLHGCFKENEFLRRYASSQPSAET